MAAPTQPGPHRQFRISVSGPQVPRVDHVQPPMTFLRIASVLAVGFVCVWGGLLLYESTRSDEEKIRVMVLEQAPAFNEGSLRGLEAFRSDFRDRTSRLRKGDLHGILLFAFRQETDPKTGRLAMRIAIPEDSLDITELDTEEGTATIELEAELHRGLDDAEKLVWAVEITAELQRDKRERWQFASSRHRTTEGRAPRF